MSTYLDSIPDYSVYSYSSQPSRVSALQHLRAHQSEPNALRPTHSLDPQKTQGHRRSSSMAEMPGQNGGMDPNGAMGEKRRNKLGYHRTAMACSHCRRRKIRCLMQPNDQQKRCINCIKLKRECNFQPVDTQGGDRRSRANSKSDFSGELSPTSSPIQSHGMNGLDAQLDGYGVGMIPGYDPNGVFPDGLHRHNTWNGIDFMEQGNMPNDQYLADPFSSFGGQSMAVETDGIASSTPHDPSQWGANISQLSSFHPTNGVANGTEDIVSLPRSSHSASQAWPTTYMPTSNAYGGTPVAFSSPYQEISQPQYDTPVTSSYPMR